MRDPNLVLIQKEVEQLHDKNQLLPRLREVYRTMDDGAFCFGLGELGIPEDFGIELLVQMGLHRRCDAPTMLGLMRRFFKTGQETASALEFCVQEDLLDWDADKQILIVIHEIPHDVQLELELYQFAPPMLVEPNPVRCNTDTGMLLVGGSIILRNNHHEDDVCLDHINRVNQIPLSVNTNTARMIQNRWAHLDRRKKGESYTDWDKRVKAFAKYDRVARGVLEALVDMGNRFWLTHRYDKRGRIYCQGYHVTTQGSAWNKAIIDLADKEHLA